MKIAHLLMVHKNPLQVERLAKALLKEDCDIYIHIDKKSDAGLFSAIFKEHRIIQVKRRIDVVWGGYSNVEAALAGIEEILDSGKGYDYINFMSGQDYPIRKLSELYGFLEKNKGNEYLEYIHAEERWEVMAHRIFKYHLTDFKFKGKYLVQKIINAVLPKRKFPIKGYKIVWKAQWFTITTSCARYVVDFLKENKTVENFFRYSWGADEFVFQTIVYNSPFKEKMVNSNFRFLDWSENKPSPKTFTVDDFDSIVNSNHYFARKFDIQIDSKVLDLLDSKVLK